MSRVELESEVQVKDLGPMKFRVSVESGTVGDSEFREVFARAAVEEAFGAAVLEILSAAGLAEDSGPAPAQEPLDESKIRDQTLWIGVLNMRKKELRAQISDVEEQLEAAHKRTSDAIVRFGLAAGRLPDGTRWHLRTDLHVNKDASVPGELVTELLLKAGLEHLITYSAPKLKAVVKETMESLPLEARKEDALPEPIRPYFEIYEETKVVVTAGPAVLEHYRNHYPGGNTDGSR